MEWFCIESRFLEYKYESVEYDSIRSGFVHYKKRILSLILLRNFEFLESKMQNTLDSYSSPPRTRLVLESSKKGARVRVFRARV